MTLKGEMALVIVRAILAHPEKFSRGLAEAACRFWTRDTELGMTGAEYWSRPGYVERFNEDSRTWRDVQELLPEDFQEKLLDIDGRP